MKEIKFRAWDKKKNKMFYSYDNYLELEGELWSLWLKDNRGKLRLLTNHNNGVLMQFTGLKDKKGREICEGDIVKAFNEDKEEYGLVYWDEEIAGFDVEGKKWVSAENLYCSWKYYEVIGNKFENPELLK